MNANNRPTQEAVSSFQYAATAAQTAARILNVSKEPLADALYDLAASVQSTALGLKHMATGLRATYMLLEKLEYDVAQLKRKP